ncbi:hypothetical protein [Brevifollis gellanilyticus]|uniref:Uncharacterized protein n=1 Tax=Brevifollis gellanilyticus TaxID=748831 RepID=A0A512M6F0_9BACT|nr:hypothetical protein [Brevifollis gellanilyticus]GEP42315.1 hypothetical protein BGE01nite_16060 [Brevifollis gellanilyticus]
MSRLLLILIVSCFSAAAVQAQTAPARPKAAAPKRAPLFVGNGTASWLPRTELLPNADAIEAEAKKLGVRKRNMDPFGLSTFPREDDAPVVTEDVYRATPKITLNQALQTLKINGVNLQKKEILIGGRQAAEGDVVELVFKGEVFMAQVVEVGAAQLLFRDLQRNETGVLRHDILPQLAIEPLQKIASQFESRMTPVEPNPPTKP